MVSFSTFIQQRLHLVSVYYIEILVLGAENTMMNKFESLSLKVCSLAGKSDS